MENPNKKEAPRTTQERPGETQEEKAIREAANPTPAGEVKPTEEGTEPA